MIKDSISKIHRYDGIDSNIIKTLKLIKEYAYKQELQDGVYEVVKNEIIIHVITKETHKRSEAKMEIHKNFMDIHYMLEGREVCYVGDLPDKYKVDYSEDTDNGFFDCMDTGKITIGDGEFYAVWPMEPHCPLCEDGESTKTVRKIIAKVRVSR